MSVFGQYQNYIQESGLDNLELYRYENIFKLYQIKNSEFYLYNIIKTIKLPKDINNEIFEIITLQNNIPLTTLSYQIYGTTYLWWLICLLNNIRNPFDINNSGKGLKILKKQYLKPVLDAIKQQLQ
jgi:hypothetical protein